MQATQPTTPTAPPEAREPEELASASIRDAHAVAGHIINQLATFPRDIDIKREFGGEYSVQIYWSSDVSGVVTFASWAKTPWHMTPDKSGDAVYAEARSVIDNVHVWAWTLLTKEEAAAAEQLLTAPRISPATDSVPDAEPAPAAVPLGESAVAQDETALYDQAMDRYAASLGGSVVALVPAVEAADDDPSTIAFATARPAAGGGL